jgi:hypothetical protein
MASNTMVFALMIKTVSDLIIGSGIGSGIMLLLLTISFSQDKSKIAKAIIERGIIKFFIPILALSH